MIVTQHYYEPPSVMQDREFKGDVSAAYAFATQVAEVEVDMETGVVKVLRITAVHDIGRVINRMGAEGQVQGGVVMGLGYALSEELQVEEGRVHQPLVPRVQADHRRPRCRRSTSPSSRPWTRRARTAPRASARRRRSAPRRPWPTPCATPPAAACTALPLTPERVFMELRR